MNKNIAIAMVLASTLAGCGPTARNPVVVSDDLDHRFIGQPANDFFRQYGMSGGGFELNDGSTIYRWASRQPSTVPTAVYSYTSPNGTYVMADNDVGASEAQYCELRIYTDPANIIQKFAVTVDTMGKWSASRCSEIFEEVF